MRDRMELLLGLDLGQSQDYSAAALVRRCAPQAGAESTQYAAIGLKRWALGTPYPQIVGDVGGILTREPCASAATRLVVDQTGCGAPVVDLFRAAGMGPTGVLITGGHEVIHPKRDLWHVPKGQLVSCLQALLQSGRLRVAARLPEAAVLQAELLAFRAKVSLAGHASFEAWRERDHDDLVLSLALALYAGEKLRPRETGLPSF